VLDHSLFFFSYVTEATKINYLSLHDALPISNWIWSDQDSIKRWNRTSYFVDKALEFLESNSDQPCFLNIWPDDVHTPWVPQEARSEEHTSELQSRFELVCRLLLEN